MPRSPTEIRVGQLWAHAECGPVEQPVRAPGLRMTLWAIADLHASALDATGRLSKPMDPFGPRWVDHVDRLEAAWEQSVRPQDTVVLVGDIDWALHLRDAMCTLNRLHRWNGHKLLVRGNHDYWWSSKTTNKVRGILPPSISLIHNDSILVDDVNVCGSKGSPVPGGIDWTPEHEKLLNRELHRLRLSLDARQPGYETIAAVHYPPYYPSFRGSPYSELMEQYRVRCCVYGHLHGDAATSGPKGVRGGVEYRLVAGDYVDFAPVPIWDGGLLPDAQHERSTDTSGTERIQMLDGGG